MNCPAEPVLNELIGKVLSGKSPAVRRLQARVTEFCANPMARVLLIRGPIGSGKSTLARLVAYCKRLALLREDEARSRLDDLRLEAPGLIDGKLMPWYLEMTVTGLVDTLVNSQLFGYTKGAFTGATRDQKGFFEQAQEGRGGDPEGGVGVTGGVVFLDEIADISMVVQARLLPVLSGARFYRLGGEGNEKHEITFNGVVIAATWQDLGPDRFRRDLLSRFSENVIQVPGITKRLEDLPELVAGITDDLLEKYKDRIGKILRVDPAADKAFLEEKLKNTQAVSPSVLARLATIDWSRHGDLRGLTQVLQRFTIGSEDLDSILETLPVPESAATSAMDSAEAFVDALSAVGPMESGLGAHVKEVERRRRSALKSLVLENRMVSLRLATSLEIDEGKLRQQARQLDRERRRRHQRGGSS